MMYTYSIAFCTSFTLGTGSTRITLNYKKKGKCQEVTNDAPSFNDNDYIRT